MICTMNQKQNKDKYDESRPYESVSVCVGGGEE